MNTQKIIKLKLEELESQQGKDSPKLYKIKTTPMNNGMKKNLDFKLWTNSLNKTTLFKKKSKESDSQSTEAYSRCNSPTSSKLPQAQRKIDHGKKTLVLDLDETLIHSEFTDMCDKNNANLILWMHGTEIGFCLFRPYLKEFLMSVIQHFEVAIFTASQPIYANQIIDKLE